MKTSNYAAQDFARLQLFCHYELFKRLKFPVKGISGHNFYETPFSEKFFNPSMPRWTAEARERQRQLIQYWKPWEHSTGPTSDYGKEVSSQNNPYCSEGWKQLKAITPVLKQLDATIKTGRCRDNTISLLPTAIEVLERVMRSGS